MQEIDGTYDSLPSQGGSPYLGMSNIPVSGYPSFFLSLSLTHTLSSLSRRRDDTDVFGYVGFCKSGIARFR